jgi:hypothetical protein
LIHHGYLGLIFLVIALAVYGFRFLLGGDKTGIRTKVEANGGKVVWIKRLDSTPESPLTGALSSETFYNVLVEHDGLRKIEVWRCGASGAFLDH